MKTVISLSVMLFLSTFVVFAQSESYWENAPNTGTKIYSIEFTDTENGWANSKLGEVLVTTDGGKQWTIISNPSETINNSQHRWRADIYCSVMYTTDRGITWNPYSEEMQDHFCQVYFKNENTGWQTAKEFLRKVVSTIKSFIKNNDCESLNKIISQCTEYYTDINNGWALGWCIKNYESN